MGHADGPAFQASSPGECDWCGQEYTAGADVRYSEGALISFECCGDPHYAD